MLESIDILSLDQCDQFSQALYHSQASNHELIFFFQMSTILIFFDNLASFEYMLMLNFRLACMRTQVVDLLSPYPVTAESR